MTRMVQCKKRGQTLPGLAFPPMKGPLGLRIYQEISAEAWADWVKHSTMVINEYRLNPAEPDAQATLAQQLEAFLFGDGAAPPAGYTPNTPGSTT